VTDALWLMASSTTAELEIWKSCTEIHN